MRDEGRTAELRRMARILLMLMGQERMPNIRWMAATLDVSTRTVRRYLDALEEAGWKLPARRNAGTL